MNTTTAKLTQRQLFLLHVVARRNGQNTHQIASAFGGNSSYESPLRDRLFNLEARGLVRSTERCGQRASHVVARTWHLTEAGNAIVADTKQPRVDTHDRNYA